MTDSNNVLIICRDLNSARRLSRFNPEAQIRYILASDDPRGQELAKEYSWIDEICWIEQMESFCNVADDVIGFLKVINKWLESLADAQRGIPKELLYWIQHCEGGMTTQRIQDLLLLIRSYLHLFEQHDITNVIILSHSGMCWEDDALIQTARSRDIDVQVIGRYRFSALKGKILVFLNIYAREPYYVLNILRIKVRNLFNSNVNEVSDKEVVIQLCSSADKHIAHTVSIMKALKNRGYNPVALCWEAFRGADKVRSEGLMAQELEKWVPISSICAALYRVFKTWGKARSRRKDFLKNPEFQYRSVSLGHLLWQSVQYFFVLELSQRYRLMVASKRYFNLHSPLAIRFWTTIFPEAVIPFQSLNKNESPIIFYAPGFPYTMKNPYEHHVIPADLVLALGVGHKKKLEQKEFSENKIVITGHPVWEHLSDFQNNYSQNQSRLFLKIPSTYSTYIFYDPGYILRGYLSPSEQGITTTFLLDFVKRHPSVALIIKPHPGHHPGIIEFLIDSYSLENVFLINKNMLPHHALNAVDLIITKFSTVGVEAMYLERPVISLILDREDKFKAYGDAAEYVFTSQELGDLLGKLINNENYRFQWVAHLRKQAKKYLNETFYSSSRQNSELAADAVDDFIKNSNHFR